MKFIDIFIISGWVNFIFSLSWGLFVFGKNYKDKTNQAFLLLCSSIALWSLGYANWIGASNYYKAKIWLDILNIGSFLIPWFFLFWVFYIVNYFPNIGKFILILGCSIIILLLLLYVIKPDFFVAGLHKKLIFNFWPSAGPFYKFYIIFDYLLLFLTGSIILFINFLKASYKKEKLKYIVILITALLGFMGGFTNFFLWYDVPILPWGNFLAGIFPIILGWFTLSIQLFNIRVLAVEFFVYLINVFAATRAFYYRNYLELFFNVIFASLIFISSLMFLRAVILEVEQREKLEELNKELERLNKIRAEFLSIASHQIRSPMVNIRGFLELLIQGYYGEIQDKAKEVLLKIYRNINEEINLVNNLLDYRKIEEGRMEYAFENINIVQVVRFVYDFYKIRAEEKKLEFILDVEKENIVIKGDEEKLKQVISNLVDNAIKYTDSGFVKISVKEEDGYVLIKVQDSGRGIEKDYLEKIFEGFERGKIDRKIAGSGLGLYIAKEFIKAHKGEIWAESEGEGKGSTFYVKLPI
jgi:signal transduction histidine kinase